MSDRARMDGPDGREVFARNISPAEKDKHTYYCWSAGYNARMFLRCCGAYNAHFATAKGEHHEYPHCRDRDYVYRCDPVAESLFSLTDAMRTICDATDNNVHHAKPTSPRTGVPTVVGNGKAKPPHTTRELYAACKAHGVNGHIGSFPVRDIFLCQKNRETYDTMLQKFCLAEVQYETKAYGLPYFFATLQIGGGKIVRLRCNLCSTKVEKDVVRRIGTIPFGLRKYCPMLIAGKWYTAVHGDADYECDIKKPSQVFFV